MTQEAVELNVAGQRCRVKTTAGEEELRELAAMVEEKLEAVLPKGHPVTTQAMLLAAIALAHDVREQRQRADAIASKATGALRDLLGRVDEALQDTEERTVMVPAARRRSAKKQQRGSDDDGETRG